MFSSFLLLLCLNQVIFAQSDPRLSIDGYFEVDYVKGCAPLTVSITAQNGQGDTRNYRWRSDNGDFIPFGTSQSFLLSNPGVYYVTQNIYSAEDGRFDSIRVEVLEPAQPTFSVFNCGSGRVIIKAVPEYYNYFIVDGVETQKLEAANNYQLQLPYSPGSKEIKVKGMFSGVGVDNNCGESSQVVDVRESLTPPASLSGLYASIETNTILLEYRLTDHIAYELEVERNGTGNFAPLPLEISGTELTLNETNFPGLDVSNNFYCFRIRTINPCNPAGGELGFYSGKICSAKLSGSPEKNSNLVRYQTGADPDILVSLRRNDTEINNFGSSAEEEIFDTEVNCNTTYAYALLISYTNGSASLTDGLSLIPDITDSLRAVENIASRWENGNPLFALLLPSPPDDAMYYAYFADSEKPELAGSSTKNLIKLLSQEENSCFNFSYKDVCGNTSLLRENVCALYIVNNTTLPDVLRFEWNEYTGYKEGVREYVLEEYDPQGGLVQTYPAGLQTSLDLGVQPVEKSGNFYKVRAYPVNSSLKETTSNEYDFHVVMKGYFPNAFSPDGDGINEIFKAEGKFITGGQLEIYNRWGVLVFKTSEVTTGWDGWTGGSVAQPGTYIFKAVIKTEDGKQETQQGMFILMR